MRRSLLLFVALVATLGCRRSREEHVEKTSSPRPAPITTFPEVRGAKLEVIDWGGSGDALVFVAGLGSSAHEFDDFAPIFADRFPVVARPVEMRTFLNGA